MAMLVYLLETLTMIALQVGLLAPALSLLTGLTVTTLAGSTPLMGNKPRDRRQILVGFLVLSLSFSAVCRIFTTAFPFLILKVLIAASDIVVGLTTFVGILRLRLGMT